ncbi:MAG: STAS-like domain-containing protein [Myxococcota bacterium]
MANNAIDHSSGQTLDVHASLVGRSLHVTLEDDGVGAFERVRSDLHLANHLEALQELSKGKTTTAPNAHTGEGLFFTSKAVEHFRLESGELAWIVDRAVNDVAVAKLNEEVQGTRIVLEVDLNSTRTLESVFDAYTEDFEFSKTQVVIKLFEVGVRFISRSEAKRLMQNLDRFRHVVLDFKGVEAIGQGFADEVFRVWATAHPGVTLEPINMIEPVAFFVSRAR